jgi:hypothetical protein
MYLRTIQRRNRDGGVVRYLQLAHNRRKGASTQAEVLVSLGREDRLVGEFGRLHLVILAGAEGRVQHTTRLTDPQRAIYQALKVAPPPVTTLDPA